MKCDLGYVTNLKLMDDVLPSKKRFKSFLYAEQKKPLNKDQTRAQTLENSGLHFYYYKLRA